MKCKQCGRQTGGFTVGDGLVLPLCPSCLSEIQRTLGEAAGAANQLAQILADLDVPADDVQRVSEPLVWTPERREAWERMPTLDKIFINAMCHVGKLFGDDCQRRFVELPEPIVACIEGCSRPALFTTMGLCLDRLLGDFNKLLHVMEIFGYEHFDFTDPPEPLNSLIDNGTEDELFSVIYECLAVLIGTDWLRRFKQNRARDDPEGNGRSPA